MDTPKQPDLKQIVARLRESKIIDLNAPAGDVIEKLIDASGGNTNIWGLYREDKWVLIGSG